MITDKQLTVSDSQAVTATAVSTNFIDTGGSNPLRNIGWGEHMRMFIGVPVAATAAGAATVQFEIVQADDAAGTTNVTALASVGPFGKAVLVPGFVAMDLGLPATSQRYVGVRYTVGTGPLTAGQFTATLVHDSDRQKFYASGYPNAA